MKVLVISHESDIDGMGSIVLAKLAFEQVDYILTDTPRLPELITELRDSDKIYGYDMVYVTDMWLSDPVLSKVANDRDLNGKFYIFDHHKSAIEESFDRYPFTKVIISDEFGKCCGTSVFYNYLLDNNYLSKNKGIYQFVELTRKYDTWEWKTRYDDNEANELNMLFNVYGPDDYIEKMYKRLANNREDFDFDDTDRTMIKYMERKIDEKVHYYADHIYERVIDNYRAGIIFVSSEYKNDLTQYLRDIYYPLDFLMLICIDERKISYRNIKSDVNVRLIAEKFGGKGHDFAAGSIIISTEMEEIINIITKMTSDVNE